MMSGVVQFDEARVHLTVKGPNQLEQKIAATIDTGYTASLTLPPAMVAALELPWQTIGRGVLADGSECLFDVYEAEVLRDGKFRRLLVDESATEPLIGMTLLRGYELKMQGTQPRQSHH